MWIPKLQLNLGPIISAPAAKGNFLTAPHNGVWGYTDTVMAYYSSSLDWVSRSFVPVFRQRTFCLQDTRLTRGQVSFLNAEWIITSNYQSLHCTVYHLLLYILLILTLCVDVVLFVLYFWAESSCNKTKQIHSRMNKVFYILNLQTFHG